MPAYKTDARPKASIVPSLPFWRRQLMRHLRSGRHKRLIDEVAAARQAAGISQRALAAKLRRSPSYVSKFEAGERRLEVCEFLDLCGAIGADPLALIEKILRR